MTEPLYTCTLLLLPPTPDNGSIYALRHAQEALIDYAYMLARNLPNSVLTPLLTQAATVTLSITASPIIPESQV